MMFFYESLCNYEKNKHLIRSPYMGMKTNVKGKTTERL